MGGGLIMQEKELKRMRFLEKRIMEIAQEFGLYAINVDYEVVRAGRMIEAMAYGLPTMIAHWTFGREYDRIRTIYEHTGGGIPYEAVWNFKPPRALLVATNPFALNILTMAHVLGHADFYLRNIYTRHGREFADIADEARFAAAKLREYEDQYGEDAVEKIIDAAFAIQWHQHPDPFHEEQDEGMVRSYLMQVEMEKLRAIQNLPQLAKKASEGEKKAIETRLKQLRRKTPPEPVFDILKYVIDRAPLLEDWERDVLRFIRNISRAFAPNRRTRLLNEGWATYWHERIMHRLAEEGLLTKEEMAVFREYHGKVTQANKGDLNVYCVGPALYEHVKLRWDTGRFGRTYEECTDLHKKENWNTGAMQGTHKIFEVAEHYSDRKAVSEFFTDEFIHGMKLYMYEAERDEQTGDIVYRIISRDPEVIRNAFTSAFALYDIPTVSVEDGNANDRGELYLRHHYSGRELQPSYRNGVMMHLHYLWRREVHLESVVEGKTKVFSYDGSKHYESL